jgi:hypothetical protein
MLFPSERNYVDGRFYLYCIEIDVLLSTGIG